MLYKGLMVTNLSGSLDGLVASHNRGGPYFRNRVVPVDPATTEQLHCRSAMSDVFDHWASMSQDQRDAWSAYAASVSTTNRIGDRRTLTGFTAWTQFALPQFQQVEALDPGRVVSVTPPVYPVSDFAESPTITIPDASHFTITWVDTAVWENTGDAADGFIVHTGRPHTALKTWYKGPFIPTHWVESDEDTPPASPLTLEIPVALRPGTGQVLDFFVRLFRSDRPNGRRWPIHAQFTP